MRSLDERKAERAKRNAKDTMTDEISVEQHEANAENAKRIAEEAAKAAEAAKAKKAGRGKQADKTDDKGASWK